MHRSLVFLPAVPGVATAEGCQWRHEGQGSQKGLSIRTQSGRMAPELKNLGRYHRNVTGAPAEAQKFFDQGLILTYGFNHAEAVRSFREAQRLA